MNIQTPKAAGNGQEVVLQPTSGASVSVNTGQGLPRTGVNSGVQVQTSQLQARTAGTSAELLKINTNQFENANKDELVALLDDALKNGRKIFINGVVAKQCSHTASSANAHIRTDSGIAGGSVVSTSTVSEVGPSQGFIAFIQNMDNQKYMDLIESVSLYYGTQKEIEIMAQSLPCLKRLSFATVQTTIRISDVIKFPALQSLNFGKVINQGPMMVTPVPAIQSLDESFPRLCTILGNRENRMGPRPVLEKLFGALQVKLDQRQAKVKALEPKEVVLTAVPVALPVQTETTQEVVVEEKHQTEEPTVIATAPAVQPSSSSSMFSMLCMGLPIVALILAYFWNSSY